MDSENMSAVIDFEPVLKWGSIRCFDVPMPEASEEPVVTRGLFHITFFVVTYGKIAVNFAIYERIYLLNLAVTTNPLIFMKKASGIGVDIFLTVWVSNFTRLRMLVQSVINFRQSRTIFFER